MLDLERAWGDALVHNDAGLMDRIVAYEMVGTDPAGHRWNKSEYVESVKSGAFKIESFELADMKVRVYGDAAVATGRSILNKHSKSSFAPGAAVFTDTYVRRNGCWQCVAWQSAAAPDQVQTQAIGLPEPGPPADATLNPGAPKAEAPLPPTQQLSAEPRAEVPGAPPLFGLKDPPPIIHDLPPLPRAEPRGAPASSAPKTSMVSPAPPKPSAE